MQPQWPKPRQPAAEWFLGLRDTIFSLAHLPDRGTPARDDTRYRQLTYGNKPHIYRVLYTVNQARQVVNIARIRHGARAPLR